MTARSGAERPEGPSGPASPRRPFRGRIPRSLMVALILLPVALLLFSCSGCSPVYVARAGWAEMKILTARRPLQEVIQDPATDPQTRHKLILAQEARAFAVHKLRLKAGDSYTTYTKLDSDTLAWILSAAYKDRLQSKTWWFPIVGRVPYRGYSSHSAAERAERDLQREGFDTYLRTTSAFSTLGWFADPLLSSILRYDDVELVATIIHELSHNQLFVPGHVTFNESYATFVGRVGAIRFFCGLEEQPQSAECVRAIHRWDDYENFSVFLDTFVPRLEAIYDSTALSLEEKIDAREDLMREERGYWTDPSRASLYPLTVSFLHQPLNNAVLLGRIRYFHRLPDFDALLRQHEGDLAETVAFLTSAVENVADPFQVLPAGDSVSIRGGE